MSKPRPFDEALVVKAQAGDERSRSDLIAAIEPIIRGYFLKRIGMRADVDDLVQNTLIRIYGGLPDLKDPSRLKGFALKAALFELHDLYRGRYGAKEYLYDPEFPPEQAREETSPAPALDLERALSTLAPKARRILELRETGYRYEEIAEMIGSTEAAIKMQVKRSFERLREVLVGLAVLLYVFWS